MYFALLGNHKELSLKELEYAHPQHFQSTKNPQFVLFSDCDEKKLTHLA